MNAGSNTVSMFVVSPFDAAEPRLVGKPAKLPGEFPNTVAVSEKHQLACVGFSGAKAGISCLPYSARGLGKAGPLHAFDLGQATPPNSLLDLLGQVFFSADEEYLYTTVRGNTGFFASTPVKAILGQSGTADAFSLKGNKTTLFDGVTVGPGKVIAADPSLGARILSVDSQTQIASVEHNVNVTGQKATCWVTYSEKTGSAYIDDAGKRQLVEFDTATGAITQELNYGGNAAGGFDLAIGGDYVYILFAGSATAPHPSITVVNTHGKKASLEEVQVFSLEPLGITPNGDGIAVTPQNKW